MQLSSWGPGSVRQGVWAFSICALIAGLLQARQAGNGGREGFEPRGFVRTPFVEIRGQVFVDRPRQLTDPIEIRLLEDSGIVRDYAGAFGSGHFKFKDVPSTGIFYIDIDVEGFEPIRYRLEGATLATGSFLTFLLKSEEPVMRFERVEEEDGADIVDLRQLQAEIPDEARSAYEESLAAADAGDHSLAVEHLERALDLAPDYFEARNNLGVQYLTLGRHSEAETAFTLARELNPNSGRPLMNLGVLYVREGDRWKDSGQEDTALSSFERAVEVLNEAVIKDPLSAEASYYLGTALYKTGQYEASEAVLYRALDLDVEMHDARLVLVNVYVRLGLMQEALEQAEAFIEQNPSSPQRVYLEEIKQRIESALNP